MCQKERDVICESLLQLVVIQDGGHPVDMVGVGKAWVRDSTQLGQQKECQCVEP